jgi:alkyldihydroxyacetonephosphate synthase
MMKARKTGLAALKSRAEKFFVTRVKGFEPNHMSACTIVFEGERSNTDAEKRAVYRLAAQHGGINGGEENGRRGYQLTFGIAYIRDWIMNHWMLAESFETSVSWDQAFELCERVKQRVHDEHAARGFPGKPFITCRITQLYETGVAIYFYFATYYKGLENPSEAYAEIERAARDEVLRCGGSLSHHHGIGKIRRGFLHRIQSPGTTEWGRQIKRSVDPTNIFGSGNQSFGSD